MNGKSACAEVSGTCQSKWESHGDFFAKTILLVEDEAFVRHVTEEVLRSAGYRVLSARNGCEADELFECCSGEIDLLLCDLGLPGEGGGDLAIRLKRRRSSMKVAFVTGYGDQIANARDEGVDCLPKPYSSAALLEQIRESLGSGVFRGEQASGTLLILDELQDLCGNLR
jgi:CheY-like chemotaxis protein